MITLEEAKIIYKHPKGHSKRELKECLDVLYKEDQLKGIELNRTQFLAISDAINRVDQKQINSGVK